VKPLDREHPTDERLLELYFEEGSVREAEGGSDRQHLHGCETCTWRYTALAAPLHQLRQDASSEADDVFTPGRLAAQRAAVRHRLEAGTGSPRVVAFPGAQVGRTRLTHRPAARWMAAAAAAGLLIGVTAGRMVHVGGGEPAAPSTRAARSIESPRLTAERISPAITTLPAAVEPGVAEMNVLYGIDSAVNRPHVAELSALDEMTPHPREILMALR
jgi:hypothetical protein